MLRWKPCPVTPVAKMRSPHVPATPTLVVLLLGALAWGGPAAAADLPTELTGALDALKAGDAKAAQARLDAAEAAAASSAQVAVPSQLATLWYYRGAAWHLLKDQKGQDMDAWRHSLIVQNDFPWDEALVADGNAWNLFEALRSEVRDRPKVDPGVPEKTGEAKIFVDGTRVRAGEAVTLGTHLGQIQCPDGQVHGLWTDFKKSPKWFKLCPGGVDTSVVVADDSGEEDEWGDIGPSFGGGESGTTATSEATTEPLPTSEAPVQVVRKKVLWPAFAAGVGAAAVAGTFQAIALKQNAAYNDINNPDYQSASDLEQLRRSTNRNQTLVYPMLAVSGGLFFAATYQW